MRGCNFFADARQRLVYGTVLLVFEPEAAAKPSVLLGKACSLAMRTEIESNFVSHMLQQRLRPERPNPPAFSLPSGLPPPHVGPAPQSRTQGLQQDPEIDPPLRSEADDQAGLLEGIVGIDYIHAKLEVPGFLEGHMESGLFFSLSCSRRPRSLGKIGA